MKNKPTLYELISQHGHEKNVWYIDVKGRDQNGRICWLSGNVMDQGQCGYGGFYTYNKCQQIIDKFEGVVKYETTDLELGSEDDIASFTPEEVYIGYAPLSIYEDNQLFLSRVL